MEDNMKNIVVLKNLPSNMIEEAIVILKTKKEARKLEYIYKTVNVNQNNKKKTKDYMVREAESVIANYISKIEKNKYERNDISNIERKYKKLKIYSIIATCILLLSIFV